MTWQEIFNQYINLTPGILAIALRLGCAMLVGIVIGLEREYTHRPAGLRTHILVALGACVVSITGEMLFAQYHALGATPDPARLSAQVITGVGFLGAGTIMKEGVSVKGLTTAASVWAVACLGIAAGFGYYALAIVGMIFTLITLTIFESLQRKLIHAHSSEDQYTLLCTDVESVLEKITGCAKDPKVTIFDLTVTRDGELYVVSFRVWFTGRKQDKRRSSFCATLAGAEGVKSVSNSSAEKKV
jgi:putative Mg2+ transporter-C (MgtC) family protein